MPARVAVVAVLLSLSIAPAAAADQYVVRFEPGAKQLRRGDVSYVYRQALNGYATDLAPADAAGLASAPAVTSVQAARTYELAAPAPATCPLDFCHFLPRGVDRIDGESSSTKSGDGRGTVPVNVAVID